jgi:zinc transport system permease protein
MLTDFFIFDFLQNALFSGILIGLVCPIIGVFLAVRRLSLISDTLSHVTLAGVATGLFLQKNFISFQMLNPVYIGMLFSLAGVFIIDRLRKVYRFYQELSLPIILSASVGLSVVLISLADGFNADVYGYLFGSLIAISNSDLIVILVITIMIISSILILFKELFFISFDDEAASTSGIPVKKLNIVFNILVALVISVSMNIVGILLVSSLITLPVAAALQLSNSFKGMFFYSIFFAELSIIIGIVLSYYFNIATGGTIVMVLSTILLVILLMKQLLKGLSSSQKITEVK